MRIKIAAVIPNVSFPDPVWSKNSKLEVGKHDHFSIGFFVHDFKPRVSFMSDHDALRA
jgi:hypothetical protein